MAPLSEMRESLEAKRAQITKLLEGVVVEEAEEDDEEAEGSRVSPTPETELTDALMLLDDCVKMFESTLDARRRDRISKVHRKNMEDLTQQVVGFLSFHDASQNDDDGEVDELNDNWEVAFLKDLGHPTEHKVNSEIGKSWKQCDSCGGWGNKWEKRGVFIKCASCIHDSRKTSAKCNFCGREPIEVIHGEVRSCQKCYKQIDRGD